MGRGEGGTPNFRGRARGAGRARDRKGRGRGEHRSPRGTNARVAVCDVRDATSHVVVPVRQLGDHEVSGDLLQNVRSTSRAETPTTPPRARHSAMRRMARAFLRGASISAPPVLRRVSRSCARPGSARHSASASSSAASPAPPTPADVLGATERWIDESVVGLNLCPFARTPRASDGIRIVVSDARDYDPFFDEFRREARRLALTYTDADHAYDEDDEDDEDDEVKDAAAEAIDPAPEDARSSSTSSPSLVGPRLVCPSRPPP